MKYNYCPLHAENASVYIGKGAGNHIKEQMENAQHSIKVISPYLSIELIDLLIKKSNQGVNVLLITSDDRSSRFDQTGQGQIVQRLITQQQIVNESARIDKEKKIRLYRFFSAIFIILIFICIFYISNIKLKIFFSGLWLICSLVFSSKVSEAKKIPIFKYKYYSKLNFRIIKQNSRYYDFFHLKAYVIDGQSAYLGSLNFTLSGFNHNVESCITVTGHAAQEIDQYISEVYGSKNISFYSEQEIVHTYFFERPY